MVSIIDGDLEGGWVPPRLGQVGIDTKSRALQQTLTHLNDYTQRLQAGVETDLNTLETDVKAITDLFSIEPDDTVTIDQPLRLPDDRLYFSAYGGNDDYIRYYDSTNCYHFIADNSVKDAIPGIYVDRGWYTASNKSITTSTHTDYGATWQYNATVPSGWTTMDVFAIALSDIKLAQVPSSDLTMSTILSMDGTEQTASRYTWWSGSASGQYGATAVCVGYDLGVGDTCTIKLRGYRHAGTSGEGYTSENSSCIVIRRFVS